MKKGLFRKIAWTNIKKNYRFFIPRILAESGLLAVFYIMFTLKTDKRVLGLRGGDYLGEFLSIGTAVITLLSVILMFYTNSFLMKQRKREFGLYNILGMEKRHIARVLFHETTVSSLLSAAAGLCIGVLFYKLCSLLICRLLNDSIILGFYFIKADNMLISAAFFMAMDLLTYAYNTAVIASLKPTEMLLSRSAGEKEPKVRWLMLVIGLAALTGGYYISVTTKQPLQAILLFFVAVILVIIGTYFLFVTGSVFVLKLLKKNEHYYYQKKHMTAVSGLLYRMKQNAVGLASICILATGVLVMISTTVSLYAGLTDTLLDNYPQHYYVSATYRESGNYEKIYTVTSDSLKEIIQENAEKQSVKIRELAVRHYLDVAYNFRDGELKTERSTVNVEESLKGLCEVTFITEETYVNLGGEKLNLAENECAICSFSIDNTAIKGTLKAAGLKFSVKKELLTFPVRATMISSAGCYGMVVSDDAVLDAICRDQKEAYGENASDYVDNIAVTFEDLNAACEVGAALDEGIQAGKKLYAEEHCGRDVTLSQNDSYWEARESVYGMYGALLFLGILLGAVCLFATVLIIYYKQISEGYEDRERFQIMQKIGMSGDEVKKTIKGQVLLVFFLPLLVAGVHLIFAFPLLKRLLQILMLSDDRLFILCSVIVYVIFALIYVLIYSGTAKTYYKIVH